MSKEQDDVRDELRQIDREEDSDRSFMRRGMELESELEMQTYRNSALTKDIADCYQGDHRLAELLWEKEQMLRKNEDLQNEAFSKFRELINSRLRDGEERRKKLNASLEDKE